jgi:uncharacterized protein GlcG (DUF336 family)
MLRWFAVVQGLVGFSAGMALAQSPQGPAAPVTLDQVVVTGAEAKSAFERNMLRLDVAEKIAKACFDFARRNDHTVTVHILDQFGKAIYVGRMDGEISDGVHSARLKAETALYFREPTSVWTNRSRDDALMALWVDQLGQFAVPGGLPIIVEDQLIGAIGVGGGPMDEACAREALISVLGRQPSLEPTGSQ